MRKIGLLGGTFDPIHHSHIEIALTAYEKLNLDEVWLIPVLNNPFKKEIIATNQQRLDMLNIALKNYPMIKINTIELEMKCDTSYTYYTLLELIKQCPNDDFFYIIGYDQVEQFEKWFKAKEIAQLVSLVCFNRKGYNRNELNIHRFNMQDIEIVETNTSSTQVRKGNFEDEDPEVIHYFINNGLYLDTIVKNSLSEFRANHSISVAKLAVEIANANNYDSKIAYVTAMLHDIAKELDQDTAKKIMMECYPDKINEPYSLWHQWTGVYLLKNKFMIENEKILHAIEVHTTACEDMDILDKILYVSDKLDPLRGYDSSKMISIALTDIHEGFNETLKSNIHYLKEKNVKLANGAFNIYKKCREIEE